MSEFILIKIVKKIGDPRLQNILIAIFDMLLFLGVYFLGMNTAYWTNQEVKKYCENYNMLPKTPMNSSAINTTSLNTTLLNISTSQ